MSVQPPRIEEWLRRIGARVGDMEVD